MKTSRTTLAFVLLAAAPAFAADAAKKADTHAMGAINAAEIKWGPAPPDLPKGAEMAVLHGDPSKKAPFTLRLKMPAGYKIPPHWHSNDEQLTILSGAFVLHMGDTMDAPATSLAAGGFHFFPARCTTRPRPRPRPWCSSTAMGPFDIHYLNPADNPNKAAGAAKK